MLSLTTTVGGAGGADAVSMSLKSLSAARRAGGFENKAHVCLTWARAVDVFANHLERNTAKVFELLIGKVFCLEVV